MADIIRQGVADLFNGVVRANANAGISWGTNNYPAGALAGWFGGPTTGLATAMAAGNIAAGNLSASNVASVLRNFTNQWAAIRRTRIVIYYAWNSGEDYVNSGVNVQYDGTAVAYTAYPAGSPGNNAALPGLAAGANASYSNMQACVNNLWSSYYEMCRNTTLTLTNTVCHTSCHDNCHCARGRR
ncbi:hypothetical protein [Streptomyces sp. CHB9.2]|uniref:hypothetical protein n=1 Tax=Streptomyces sp. CHB9.2 TaxID=2841670 RepID=UPI00209580E6|nr:hypothetical protein [Streptomyces sp. CHB9.2]MCO6704828.1 hypothetical protein [Streptomyces sp. CHB9.2]